MVWQDNSLCETGFKIWRKVGSGTYTQVAAVAANSATWTDATVVAGYRYCYVVRAYNALGNSLQSNEACGCTGTPSPPSGLDAWNVWNLRIRMEWQDNSLCETGFKIWRKVGYGGTYALVKTLGANVTTWTDTVGVEGYTYCYVVAAYNALSTSAYSNQDCAQAYD